MRLQNNKLDDFLKTIDKEKNIYGALIYGPDEGLVNIRFKETGKKIVSDLNDNFNVINLTEKQVTEEPSIIFDEFLSISMLGDRKLITIKNLGSVREKTTEDDGSGKKTSIISILEEISETKNTGDSNFILITAGDLDTKSALRKFFENSERFVVIPCYTDDSIKISQIISLNLKNLGFSFTKEVVDCFVANAGCNRMIVMSELEKLSLYMGDKKEITIEDIKACVTNAEETDIGDLVNEFCNLNAEKALFLLRNMEDSGEEIVLIRSLISYFLKLQLIKYQLQNGKELTSDFLRLEHKVFWKQEESVKRHLKLWNSRDIFYVLESLIKLEKDFKSTNYDNSILLEKYISSTVNLFQK